MEYIFQTWKREDLEGAHPFFELSRHSWKTHHPTWQYDFFDDVAIDRLVSEHTPLFYRNYFKKYIGHIKRVDSFRYVNLFVNGGIYSDLDGECLTSFGPLLDSSPDDHIIGSLKSESSPNRLPNALMISKMKGGNFWLYVLALAVERFEDNRGYFSTEYLTGPILLTDAILSYQSSSFEQVLKKIDDYFPDRMNFNRERKESIRLLDYKYVYPIDWHQFSHEERQLILDQRIASGLIPKEKVFPETLYVNYWTYSWTKPVLPWWQKVLLRTRYFYFKFKRRGHLLHSIK